MAEDFDNGVPYQTPKKRDPMDRFMAKSGLFIVIAHLAFSATPPGFAHDSDGLNEPFVYGSYISCLLESAK